MIPSITMSGRLLSFQPDIVLGVISGNVSVSESKEKLDELVETCVRENSVGVVADLARMPRIESARNFYRAIGQDPSRYRVSSEALLRRIVQGKGLYRVNNVVDINNLLSIQTRFSVGSYDLANIQQPIIFGIGKMGEVYQGIGKGVINIDNLPVFYDVKGPFGSPTSDSRRAMITTNTSLLMMVVISFSGEEGVGDGLKLGMQLLADHAGGEKLSSKLVGRGSI